jgi:hypothetical protein
MIYDCINWSNIVEPYSLLEPDVSAASAGSEHIKTTLYGEIVQMKQDRIIPTSDVR